MTLPSVVVLLVLVAGVLGSKPKCSRDNKEALVALSNDTNQFGWNLYREIVKGSTDNAFLSAASISAAFGMLYIGAKGSSSRQIKNALFPNVADNLVTSGYLSVLSEFEPISRRYPQPVRVANGAFIEQTDKPLDDYINTAKKCFHSEVMAMDFLHKPDAEREKINRWVVDKTKGTIRNLLPQDSVSEYTKLVIANAIYFKGQWLHSFNKRWTRSMPFFGMGYDTKRTEMMMMVNTERKFSFYEDRLFRIIELPYVGNAVSMFIILPENFQEVESYLSNKFINTIQQRMRPTILEKIVLPKWKISREIDLINLLKKLGVTSVFNEDRANLSGITGAKNMFPKLFVSGAFHKAFVKVHNAMKAQICTLY